jgi:hypothetical protein
MARDTQNITNESNLPTPCYNIPIIGGISPVTAAVKSHAIERVSRLRFVAQQVTSRAMYPPVNAEQ